MKEIHKCVEEIFNWIKEIHKAWIEIFNYMEEIHKCIRENLYCVREFLYPNLSFI